MIRRDAGVKPLSVRYTLEATAATGNSSSSSCSSSSKAGLFSSSSAKAQQQQHHPDGRIIVLEYPSFDLLGCYAPNNGTDEKSFLRRRQWDSAIQIWLTAQVAADRRYCTSACLYGTAIQHSTA
jgi:exonuclease III